MGRPKKPEGPIDDELVHCEGQLDLLALAAETTEPAPARRRTRRRPEDR